MLIRNELIKRVLFDCRQSEAPVKVPPIFDSVKCEQQVSASAKCSMNLSVIY
jgi:hypothetical protein